jgi:hypothetical protein
VLAVTTPVRPVVSVRWSFPGGVERRRRTLPPACAPAPRRARRAALDGANSAKGRADAGAAGVRRNLMRLRRRAAPTTASGKSVDT